MGKENLISFFQNTGLVPYPLAILIAERFKNKLIMKNQFQLSSGKLCNEYLFVEKGFMRAFANDTKGNEVTTNFYSPGQIIFEVSSFFNRTKSKESIQAVYHF